MKRTSDPNAIVTCLNLRLGLIQTISIIGHNRNQHHCANGRRKNLPGEFFKNYSSILVPGICTRELIPFSSQYFESLKKTTSVFSTKRGMPMIGLVKGEKKLSQ